MIGHVLNGCTIVAAAPAKLRGGYVILAVRNDPVDGKVAPGDPYVTATVATEDMPTPDHWNNGHYLSRIEDAVRDYLERATDDPLWFAQGVAEMVELVKAPDLPSEPVIEDEVAKCPHCGSTNLWLNTEAREYNEVLRVTHGTLIVKNRNVESIGDGETLECDNCKKMLSLGNLMVEYA